MYIINKQNSTRGTENNRYKTQKYHRYRTLSMTIWKHRNSMVFNNQLFIPEKVMDETLFHTWSWLRCMEKNFNTHFNHWLSNLRGMSNNLKVVHSGTKEFKIAKRLRKKLALEEGRIFAANEQLS
ncbi:hypothetical protein GmHk_12G035199 [Glycine max]|nr:hypothetical protein GmHk_12G035199 [Glycine max]